MRILLTLLVAAALPAAAQTAFGRRAPGFSLPDIKLKQHDLQDYRGKVVLIDFMRTECPDCVGVTKALEQVRAKYGNSVQVLSVVTFPGDNQATVTKYVAAHKITYPVLFDCGQMTASYLQITPEKPAVHYPHLIVVDKNGMIRRDFAGKSATAENIIAAVEPLVK
jgi:peroxiredoxin